MQQAKRKESCGRGSYDVNSRRDSWTERRRPQQEIRVVEEPKEDPELECHDRTSDQEHKPSNRATRRRPQDTFITTISASPLQRLSDQLDTDLYSPPLAPISDNGIVVTTEQTCSVEVVGINGSRASSCSHDKSERKSSADGVNKHSYIEEMEGIEMSKEHKRHSNESTDRIFVMERF